MSFRSPLFALLSELKRGRLAFVAIALFSALINVLALTSSIYMLQLYDRVIPSHSVPTLVGLSVLMLVLFAGYGVLDGIRTRLLSRIGGELDRSLRGRVYDLLLTLPLRSAKPDSAMQPVRDLDQVRTFVSGSGPVALYDLPWMPFYLGLVYLMHPWLGILALSGAVVLIGLTILTDLRTRAAVSGNVKQGSARTTFAEATRRNAEAIAGMGMRGPFADLWSHHSESQLAVQTKAGDVACSYGTLSKVLRYVLQSAVLGLGAYLVINGQATGGVMIAASILTSRALAPVEIAIANWRGFLSAREGARRLLDLFKTLPASEERLELPPPERELKVEGLSVSAPGQGKPIIQNVGFAVPAGTGLGVIGPSASGKSTLARALVGAWLPQRGSVRLDKATLDQWSSDAIGRHIGYLPQEAALFDGTVAQNISRFAKNAKSADIVAAAQIASIHDMIVALPDGYETRIGEGGAALSAGQRQRVGLARALYGNPFLVVLDEPNANLDADGDAALTQAIQSIRARGGVAVVVAHRPSALAAVDQLLVLGNGQMQAFGPKDEVLRKVMATAPAQQGRLKVVSEGEPAHG